MSTDIDKIVGIINQQALGNDPEKVAQVVFKKIEAFDSQKYFEVIYGLSETGSLEVGVHLISEKREDAKELIIKLFETLKQEKFYDEKIVAHFEKLLESKDLDQAKEFIINIENDYFSTIEKIGYFGSENDAMGSMNDPFSSSIIDDPTEFKPTELETTEIENFETDLEVKHIFEALFEEIFADGIVTDVERRFIGELRRVFKITQADYKKLYIEGDEKYKKGLLEGREDASPIKIYERIVAKALEDGVLTTEENDILFSVAQTLFIDMDTHLMLVKKYSNPQAEDKPAVETVKSSTKIVPPVTEDVAGVVEPVE